MSGLSISGSVNAYGNKNAKKLLRDIEYIGGDLNIAGTDLSSFPCLFIKKITGHVYVSKNAPASLLKELGKLKEDGVICGDILLYGCHDEEVSVASQDEVFSVTNIASILCFRVKGFVQIIDSEDDLSPQNIQDLDCALESQGNGDGKGIVDLLGAYFAEERRVKIYIHRIEYVSRRLNRSFIGFYNVVKVHEICHAVQHLGLDQRGDGLDTQKFINLPSEIIEPLAEYWTWIVLVRIQSTRCVESFFGLDAISPQKYRAWRKLAEYHPEVIRYKWIVLREGTHSHKNLEDFLQNAPPLAEPSTQEKLNHILGCPTVHVDKDCKVCGKSTGVDLCVDCNQVQRYLDLANCTHLKNLGHLSASGDLNCSDCTELTALGDLKKVDGDLELAVGGNNFMISGTLLDNAK